MVLAQEPREVVLAQEPREVVLAQEPTKLVLAEESREVDNHTLCCPSIFRQRKTIEGPSQTWKSIKGPAAICDDEVGLLQSDIDNGSTYDDDVYCVIDKGNQEYIFKWINLEIIQEKEKSCIDGEWVHEIDLDTIDNYDNKQIESAMNEKYSLGLSGSVEENTPGSNPSFIPNEKGE